MRVFRRHRRYACAYFPLHNVLRFDLFLFFFFFYRLRLAETRRHHEAILHANLDGLAVLNHEYVIFEGKEVGAWGIGTERVREILSETRRARA